MTTVLIALAFNLAVIGLLIWYLRRNIISVPPNEVAVLTGRKNVVRDPITGATETIGFRLITGGSALKIPLLERDDRLPLSEMSIQLDATDLRDASGQTHELSVLVNCCIVAEEPFIGKAIVRFLGMKLEDIEAIVGTTIEGRVSNSLLESDLSSEISWDALEQRMSNAIREDLAAIGVRVDNLIFRGPPVLGVAPSNGNGAGNPGIG